jgi:phosphate transport system protein
MPEPLYHDELVDIKASVVKMGEIAKDALWLAMEALAKSNGDKIEAVRVKNEEIDTLEFRTENRCMVVLATHHPVGKDLRVLGTCLKILSDIDRLGDYAGNITKIVKHDLAESPPLPDPDELMKMANIADSMLTRALAAFKTEKDVPVDEIQNFENQMDEHFKHIVEDLTTQVTQNSKLARGAMAFAFVARYLERFGDHVSNISGRVYYMLTGKRIDIE